MNPHMMGGQPERLATTSGRQAGYRDFFALIKPYFLPKETRHRISAASCFILLGLSKVCNLLAPLYLGTATDQLVAGEFPLQAILTFGVLRFLVSAFEEGQRLVYLKVKQAAYCELAVSVFDHLHSLSLQWHINKRSGVVLRAMDRGISSASTVVDNLFLRLVPSILEMLALVILFFARYNSLGASVTVLVTFGAYFAVTFYVARKRSIQRGRMNRADNLANDIAVSTINAFETVKSFNAESFESRRYKNAIEVFQEKSREQQGSLVMLNVSQSLIIRIATVGVLISAAQDVLSGRQSVGAFVAMLTFISQLFVPLSWLGTMYSMLQQAYTDMKNLADLMLEQPDVKDAPHAPSLVLRNTNKLGYGGGSSGATIEFRDVCFTYPLISSDKIEQDMEKSKVEEATSNHKAKLRAWKAKKALHTATLGLIGDKPGPQPSYEDSFAAASAVGVASRSPNASATASASGVSLTAGKAGGLASHDANKGGAVELSRSIGNGSAPHGHGHGHGHGGGGGSRPTLDVSAPPRSFHGHGHGFGSPPPSSAMPLPTSATTATTTSVSPAAGSSASTGAGRQVLKGVSFTIPAGKVTAIVGPTGSGKSTIAKLLFRFYDVDGPLPTPAPEYAPSYAPSWDHGAGSSSTAKTGSGIFIDGQDIRSVTQTSLRSVIGLVPQDCVLFNETLRFNIRYGNQSASDAEVLAAASAAQLDGLIATLPEGLDTKVGERGLRLSGGERQRLALARCMLRDPPILVLDEATSALDTNTERLVTEAIRRARGGRTVLSIAHRLSTIKDADEIIVLADGLIVERGTHDQLLATPGSRYASLWSQQAADAAKAAEEAASLGGTTGSPTSPASAVAVAAPAVPAPVAKDAISVAVAPSPAAAEPAVMSPPAHVTVNPFHASAAAAPAPAPAVASSSAAAVNEATWGEAPAAAAVVTVGSNPSGTSATANGFGEQPHARPQQGTAQAATAPAVEEWV